MQKTKTYCNAVFPLNVIKEAYSLFLSKLDPKKEISPPLEFRIGKGDEKWSFENTDEFFAQYSTADSFYIDHFTQGCRFHTIRINHTTATSVCIESSERRDIEAIFEVFERNLATSIISIESPPVKLFIGHGRDAQWRDLKDHLHDQHGFEVVAYEIGPRAGLSVKEVLQDMLSNSSFALLVLTGEDEHVDGTIHARENVIHELGLFQGRLGFTKAIVLLEEGVREFSNILGINQIRFSKDSIRETFGDVLATIKREFEDTK